MTADVMTMSLEEYLARPEYDRAEYADGVLIVNPPPSLRHQYAARKLAGVIEAACPPHLLALEAVGWVMGPRGPVRIPDLVVISRAQLKETDGLLTEAPVLAAEILSPGERPDRKLREYGRSGLRHDLTFDLRAGSLRCYEGDGHRLTLVEEAVPGRTLTLTEPFGVAVDPVVLQP
jgi:Uma2 family endonuclease